MNAAGPIGQQSGEGTPALELAGVAFTYPRVADARGEEAPRPALEAVSLTVRVGERLGVLGPNGGGKSTLLKIVLGLLKPDAGTVRVFGLPPERARRERLVGYVPQRVEAELAFPLSVRQVVSMGAGATRRGFGRSSADERAAVEEALAAVGIADLAERPIGKLSGGQLQRAMIARALAGRPRLLVLDEPAVGIEVQGQRRLAALVAGLHDTLGLTIVTVRHDLATVAATSDRVACLRRTLHYHDAPGGLTPAVLAEVFSHDVEPVFGAVHVEAHRAAECDDPGHHHHDHAGHGGCDHDHHAEGGGRA